MSSSDLIVPESVESLSKTDLSSLKASEIGLNILLLKLAQAESARIRKLATVIEKLEDSIFDINIIEHLTPSEQIQRYELALQATSSSRAYIAQATKSINWQDIETKIMILESEAASTGEKSSVQSNDLQLAAMRLLQQLSQDGS